MPYPYNPDSARLKWNSVVHDPLNHDPLNLDNPR